MCAQVVTGAPPVTKLSRLRGRPHLRIGLPLFLVFLGYKVLPFYYYYYDLRVHCAQVIRNASVESDEEIRRNLYAVVQRNGVRLEPRDIRIQRFGGRIRLWMTYHEVLDISLFGKSMVLYNFEFVPSAEGVYDE